MQGDTARARHPGVAVRASPFDDDCILHYDCIRPTIRLYHTTRGAIGIYFQCDRYTCTLVNQLPTHPGLRVRPPRTARARDPRWTGLLHGPYQRMTTLSCLRIQ